MMRLNTLWLFMHFAVLITHFNRRLIRIAMFELWEKESDGHSFKGWPAEGRWEILAFTKVLRSVIVHI